MLSFVFHAVWRFKVSKCWIVVFATLWTLIWSCTFFINCWTICKFSNKEIKLCTSAFIFLSIQVSWVMHGILNSTFVLPVCGKLSTNFHPFNLRRKMWIEIQYRWEPIKIQYKADLYPVASYPGYQRESGGEIILRGMIEEGSWKHRRPKLTIRGIDQIFMIYLRVSSETWLLYVCGVVLHIGPLSARSTRHCMEFKITKDKIAEWNKMPLFLNKIK